MVDQEKVEAAIKLLLEGIGEDPTREGLLETPARVARMYGEIAGGMDQSAEEHLSKTFAVASNDLVIERDITFYSLCEHHLLPFYGKAAIGYIPNGRVAGLSKLARTVEVYARRLQLQEQYGEYNVNFIGPDEKRIYLTFDEGYENGNTADILDILKEKQVQAVFFVTGHYCKTNPELVQRMIDEGLVNTHLKVWSEDWKRALGGGSVASVFAGAWMPSLLLADVPGTSGLWRVTRMPTQDGTVTNAENGGSALGVLHTTRKPEAAFRFVDYVCHNKSGIKTRVDGGAFPADNATLNSGEFLNKTTVTSEHHAEVEYFGGQRFNEVLSEAAESVSVGYQYLPFEVYARSHFRSATADAYTWSAAKQAYDRAKARKDAGLTNDDGGPITLPDRPGKKITLMSGIAAWQRDLKEYGVNQGFTIK